MFITDCTVYSHIVFELHEQRYSKCLNFSIMNESESSDLRWILIIIVSLIHQHCVALIESSEWLQILLNFIRKMLLINLRYFTLIVSLTVWYLLFAVNQLCRLFVNIRLWTYIGVGLSEGAALHSWWLILSFTFCAVGLLLLTNILYLSYFPERMLFITCDCELISFKWLYCANINVYPLIPLSYVTSKRWKCSSYFQYFYFYMCSIKLSPSG